MNLLDCAGFLIGEARAIRRIAACRGALWVGLLFVAMASLAREYDQEDLVHEPLRLLLSPLASLGVASVLFVCVWGIGSGSVRSESMPTAWRRFVTLFWMTGPLAWIYAIPYEQFLDGAVAAEANLWTLGVVAAWRVVLIIRVISVVHGVDFGRVAAPVLLIADLVAILLVQFLPFPIIVLMGGVRDPAEQVVAGIACCTLALCLVTLPVWIVATARTRVVARKHGGWRDGPAVEPASRVHLSVWLGAVVLLAMAAPAVVEAQRKQVEATRQQRVEDEQRAVQQREARLRGAERVRRVLAAVGALEAGDPIDARTVDPSERTRLRGDLLETLSVLEPEDVDELEVEGVLRVLRAVLARPGMAKRCVAPLRLFTRRFGNQPWPLGHEMFREWARAVNGR
jgi:heme/copper-type cytochrome/quinol oxidase subunit 2